MAMLQDVSYVLTWPCYGTWLTGASRGRVERCRACEWMLPEPDRDATERRRAALKWPIVLLSAQQQRLLGDAIAHMAEYREFEPIMFVSSEDHVHLMFRARRDVDLLRLIQLIKGSLARRLSHAAGDPPPASASGTPVAHLKWWMRQYIAQELEDPAAIDHARNQLRAHSGQLFDFHD